LPADVDDYLPGTLMGPDDTFVALEWLYQALLEVAGESIPVPAKPSVRFDTSPKSVQHNSNLLLESNYDFNQFLAANAHTKLNYRSKFHPIPQLEKVLGPHPNFAFFRSILCDGMHYRFKSELSEEQRQAQLLLKRG
jgi:hypothetical protein